MPSKNYLQTHGTAMGSKMSVAFANIFKAKVETNILSRSDTKPLVWKRFIDDIFSIWKVSREEIAKFRNRNDILGYYRIQRRKIWKRFSTWLAHALQTYWNVKTCNRWQAAHLHRRETFEIFYILLHWGDLFQGSYSWKFERWYRFYIADQDTARYSLCSARENCVSWAEPLKCTADNLFSSRVFLLNL